MKKAILTLIVLVISTLTLLSQTEVTTKDGKKIILNDDGTWKYAEQVLVTNPIPNNSDCSEFIISQKDKMTGKTNVSSKDVLVVSKDGSKNGFGILILMATKGSIILSIQAVGAGNCIDDDDKMNVLFRDGTRLVLSNDADFNCEANYTQYFGGVFGKKKELILFRTKEVETIRVWTSDGYVEEDFSPEQSNQLMKTIDCLLNN